METNWKHLDKKLILLRLINNSMEFIALIPAYKGILYLFHIPKKFHGLVLLFFIFLVFAIIIHIFLEYFNTKYYLDSKRLLIKKGSFTVHSFEFHANNLDQNLSNFRTKQTWWQKILHLQELDLFLKNSEEESKQISLKALNQPAFQELQRWLDSHLNKQEVQTLEDTNDSFQNYHIPLKKIAISSLFSLNYLLAIPFLLDVQEWCERFHFKFLKKFSFENFQTSSMLSALFFAFLLMYSIVQQYLKFGKFSLAVNSGNFFIRNGLFNTDTHTVKRENIYAVIQESSLGMKLLNLSTMSVLTENNFESQKTKSKNDLFPFLKNEELSYYESHFFPTFSFESIKYSKEKAALWIEIFLHVIDFLILGVVFFIFRNFFIKHLFISSVLIVLLISTLIKPFTTSLSRTTEGIQIQQGILNHKKITIPKDTLEYIEIRSISIKKKTFILHANIFLHGTPVKKIKILAPPKEAINHLKKCLGDTK